MRNTRVDLDVLDVVSGTGQPRVGRDASVFVSSRVCMMRAR
ncbi:MAG TPA: hypothetical protein VH397_07900 [Xanthobacteraceae bacterium]|jgi:hypothetical protein